MYGPITVTDCIKMLWWMLIHPSPPLPAATESTLLREMKRDLNQNPVKPVFVVPASDHSYRRVTPRATTAILCEVPGQKASLHEDHFPNDKPGPGFDEIAGMKLTRVNVLVVE